MSADLASISDEDEMDFIATISLSVTIDNVYSCLLWSNGLFKPEHPAALFKLQFNFRRSHIVK